MANINATTPITWTATPRQGVEKQGQFNCGGETYHVERRSNKLVTISTRVNENRVSVSPDGFIGMGGIMGGKGISMKTQNMTLYAAMTQDVNARDITELLNCDDRLAADLCKNLVGDTVSDLLAKAEAIIQGSVSGKAPIDSVELLEQYIHIMQEEAIDAGMKLANLLLEEKVDATNEKQALKILEAFGWAYHFSAEHEGLQGKLIDLFKLVNLPSFKSRAINTNYIEKEIAFLESIFEAHKSEGHLSHLCATYGGFMGQDKIPGKTDEDAQIYLEKAIKYDPENEGASRNLSVLYGNIAVSYADGDVEGKSIQDAMLLLERALKIDSTNEHAKRNLLAVYNAIAASYSNGQVEGKENLDALPLLEKALAIKADDQQTRKNMSQLKSAIAVTYANGKVEGKTREDAIALLKSSLEFDPDNEHAKNNASLLYNVVAVSYANGEVVDKTPLDAMALLREAIALKPDNQAATRKLEALTRSFS